MELSNLVKESELYTVVDVCKESTRILGSLVKDFNKGGGCGLGLQVLLAKYALDAKGEGGVGAEVAVDGVVDLRNHFHEKPILVDVLAEMDRDEILLHGPVGVAGGHRADVVDHVAARIDALIDRHELLGGEELIGLRPPQRGAAAK